MKTFRPSKALSVMLALAGLAACEHPAPTAVEPEAAEPVVAEGGRVSAKVRAGQMFLNRMNRKLEGSGDYALAKMEYITAPKPGRNHGTTVLSTVGRRLRGPEHFAPAFTFPAGVITYAVDEADGGATGGVSASATTGAIDAAMSTWDGLTCSDLGLTRLPGSGFGVVQSIAGYGGAAVAPASVNHGGWLPGSFFDLLAPGGSQEILGVTFTAIVLDGGNPVDTNRDGMYDVAFREIYYNNAFAWSTSPQPWFSNLIDAQTVALHEAGHGLSQDHFGRIFLDPRWNLNPSPEYLHFAPRAVMNAMYWDSQRFLRGSDKSGHCRVWAGWN